MIEGKVHKEEIQFVQDLNCLQSLLNKEYIEYLIDLGIFKDDDFFLYLKYLRYFKEEKYITCLIYPDSIIILEKLIYMMESYFRQKGEKTYDEFLEEIRAVSSAVDKHMKELHF